MNDGDSSARTTKQTHKAEFRLGKTDDWTDTLAELGSVKTSELASQKREQNKASLASQKREQNKASLASQKREQNKASLASQKHNGKAVKVKATEGKGQKSQTVKINGLTFRVRLSDRGFRVMLLTVEQGRQREPYLCSLRRSEWESVKTNSAALLAKVVEKLRARIVKADDNEAAKLKTLLATIEEKSNGQKN